MREGGVCTVCAAGGDSRHPVPSHSRVCDHCTACGHATQLLFTACTHAASASTDRAATPADALDQPRRSVRSAGVGGRPLRSALPPLPSPAPARSTCTIRPAGQRVMPLFTACTHAASASTDKAATPADALDTVHKDLHLSMCCRGL